jgi:ABC-2 type transport system ATP-binding protein
VVGLDAEPKQAIDLLTSMESIESIEQLTQRGIGYRYALNLADQSDVSETAPKVANLVHTQGMKLYTLQPESRDLETIFGEISAR